MARPRTDDPPEAPQRAQDGTPGPGPGTDAPEPGDGRSGPQGPYAEAVEGGTIHARMVTILAELPAIGKDSENTQQNFMFRSHDAVLNALNPLLAKHAVYVVPYVLERLDERRETANGKIMFAVHLHVRYTFVAEDGSWMQCSAWGEGTDMGDKATNKAMTMAFKNVLAQSFAVSTKDTQDADAGTPPETVARPPAPAAPSAAALRDRIIPLLVKLDTQTKAEQGTWHKLVDAGAVAAFEKKFAELGPEQLTDVGKFLKAQVDAKITETPEQIDFTVPF